MFFSKKRLGQGDEKDSGYCRYHNQRIIQLGNVKFNNRELFNMFDGSSHMLIERMH